MYIYGRSEADLSDGNVFDPFGFGPGILLPGVAAPGAFDSIFLSDMQTIISGLVVVNYNTTDFQQTPSELPAVVLNAGFEGNSPIADDITAMPSPSYAFQINGGDPDPATTGIVPPDGDRLSIWTFVAELNIWSDKSSPPNVVLGFGASGLLPINFSSIERVDAGGASTVNLIGDQNDPLVDQVDNFTVEGTGYQGLRASVNGSGWIYVSGLQFLNVLGDDLTRTPSVGPNDVDSLNITPLRR